MLARCKGLYFIFGFKKVRLQPRSVIRIAPLSLLTLNSISLVLRSISVCMLRFRCSARPRLIELRLSEILSQF